MKDPDAAVNAAAPVGFDEYKATLDDELCTFPAESQVFTRANALDQWPMPITPLTQDLVALPQERGLEEGFVRVLGVSKPSPEWTWNGCFYGYVMFGVSPAAGLADNLPGWDRAGVYADYLGVQPDPDASPESPQKPSFWSVAKIGKNFVGSLRSYQKAARREIDAGRKQLTADLNTDFTKVSDAELRERIAAFPSLHTRQRMPHGVGSVIAAALFKQLVSTLVGLAGEEDGARLATEIITGLGGVHMGDATRAMSAVARGSMTRTEFLQEYGFRGTNEFELEALPWSEDHQTLDRLIQAAGREHESDTMGRRDAARARVKDLAGVRWVLISRQISLTESHLRWRENGKIPMALGVASIRHVVREAGRRLVDRGRISQMSDVFYLRFEELLEELGGSAPGSDRKASIAKRRDTHVRAKALPLPEMIDARPDEIATITEKRWAGLGLLPPSQVDVESSVLRGVSGSRGTATGRARIVSDPNEVIIDEGDILIAKGTDSAWTPLFMQANAVVVDIGGVMSHACIAAREIGIPCVIDVKTGTTRFAEGQLITVDGDAGTVTACSA